jgi:hypothetical protein
LRWAALFVPVLASYSNAVPDDIIHDDADFRWIDTTYFLLRLILFVFASHISATRDTHFHAGMLSTASSPSLKYRSPATTPFHVPAPMPRISSIHTIADTFSRSPPPGKGKHFRLIADASSLLGLLPQNAANTTFAGHVTILRRAY